MGYYRDAVAIIKKHLAPTVYRIRGVHHVNIDIVNACNLQCPQCPRGTRIIPNTPDVMPLELYRKLCSRFKEDGIRSIALFNWTEPFLHQQIAEFVEETEKNGFKSILSSNLSLPDISTIDACFEAGLRQLIVSVSGFSNDVQTIYHRGSNVDVIKGNLEKIAKNKSNAQKTTIKFLHFKYNDACCEQFKRYAADLGMEFLGETAKGDPLSDNDSCKIAMSFPSNPPCTRDAASGTCFFPHDPQTIGMGEPKICFFGAALTLDYMGRLYLCCDRAPLEEFCLGDYLSLSTGDILLRKYLHPECRTCTVNSFVSLTSAEKELMKKSLFS